MNDNNDKQRKVIAQCPVCMKNFRSDGEEKIITTQYVVAVPPGFPPMNSFPKICCLNCGVEFFPKEVLVELRKKAKGDISRIITPQVNMKIVK